MRLMVRRGDRYRYGPVEITVLRVARDGSWADIRCCQEESVTWTKRQPLPFPSSFRPTTP